MCAHCMVVGMIMSKRSSRRSLYSGMVEWAEQANRENRGTSAVPTQTPPALFSPETPTATPATRLYPQTQHFSLSHSFILAATLTPPHPSFPLPP